MDEKKTELVEVKKPWQSKTNWVALIMAIGGFFPSVWVYVEENPDMFMKAVGVIFFVLRYATKGKVSIS